MTKYRLVHRKKRWRVQQYGPAQPQPGLPKAEWFDQGIWRWRLMGAIHLAVLRHLARKRK